MKRVWAMCALTALWGLSLTALAQSQYEKDDEKQNRRTGARSMQQDQQHAGSSQQQTGMSGDLQQAAQMMKQSGKGLESAIRAAERETNGTAVAARARVKQDTRMSQHDRMRGHGEQDRQQRTQERRERTGQQDERQQAGQRGQGDLMIEVLCLTDQGQLKVAVVDGQTGQVQDVRTAARVGRSRGDEFARGTGGSEWDDGQSRYDTFRVLRVSKLEGASVRTRQGENVGEVEALAIRTDAGQVAYVAVDPDDELIQRGDYLAISLDELDIRRSSDVRLVTSREELKQRQGFARNDWPSDGEGLDREAAMRMPGSDRERTDRGQRGGSVTQSKDIIGRSVRSADGEDVGKVEDLFIDPERGRVAALVLSKGGFLGLGDKLIAMPWESVQRVTRDAVQLSTSASKLKEAPEFEKQDWSRTEKPDWLKQTYQHFGASPYWEQDSDSERSRRHGERETDRP